MKATIYYSWVIFAYSAFSYRCHALCDSRVSQVCLLDLPNCISTIISTLTSVEPLKVMASRRMPPRARTTPIETVHSLLSAQEADRATRLRPPNRGPFLQNYAELPAWQQDNQYILTHYRPASYSFKGCAASLFYLHNESVNVHSHLLGAFLFFFISISLFVFERYTVEMGDIIAFAFFFAGAIACLGLSAGYHLISNHSPSVNRLANQVWSSYRGDFVQNLMAAKPSWTT